jgi:drug/metabolite transporter (DMT)-like permease
MGFAMFIRVCSLFSGFLILSALGKLSKKANISPAIVTSLICTAPFVTATIFFFYYKERLLPKHLIGMLSLLIGIVSISLAKVFSINV